MSQGIGIYKIHFYCLAEEAGFYSDVVECLPVDPATWVQFPAGTGKKYFRSTTIGTSGGTMQDRLNLFFPRLV